MLRVSFIWLTFFQLVNFALSFISIFKMCKYWQWKQIIKEALIFFTFSPFYNTNQMTGFSMKRNTELTWVEQKKTSLFQCQRYILFIKIFYLLFDFAFHFLSVLLVFCFFYQIYNDSDAAIKKM